MISEERDDDPDQFVAALHGEAKQRRSMIVVSGLLNDPAAPEYCHLTYSSAASDGAACTTANSCWTCQPSAHVALRTTEIGEASLAVDKADDPLLGTWPFLLIVRTGRIVTAHRSLSYPMGVTLSWTSTAGCSEIPAYSQLLFSTSPC